LQIGQTKQRFAPVQMAAARRCALIASVRAARRATLSRAVGAERRCRRLASEVQALAQQVGLNSRVCC
jgi:hypothetical protein